MRILAIAAVAVAAFGMALGQGVPPGGVGAGVHPVAIPQQDEPPAGGGVPVPTPWDADRDGFGVTIDCNDDDPAVNPAKIEALNGVDDDCNGVVDDGFDTTIDWPRVESSSAVWPGPAENRIGEFVSADAEARLVWAGDRYMAVWSDVRGRLRLARIGRDGTLLEAPSYLRKPVRGVDAAWTGTRLGIVYEDMLLGGPDVRLMLVDATGLVVDDVALAIGSEPRIAWGQDRFGVVWKVPGGGVNALRYQQFDTSGRPVSAEESLPNSGSRAAITFSATSLVPIGNGQFTAYEGWFGIAYEAYYGVAVSGDVLLGAWPREPGSAPPLGPIVVNEHADPNDALGAMPTIAANPAGFAVGWHAVDQGRDAAKMRVFSLAGLKPVQEFTADADLGRYGRMVWTGGDFVMANDNRNISAPDAFDVHVRRVDASGNTHLAAGWGPWGELRLRDTVPGWQSTHPDVANGGDALGVMWVEGDNTVAGVGRLWFAIVTHR